MGRQQPYVESHWTKVSCTLSNFLTRNHTTTRFLSLAEFGNRNFSILFAPLSDAIFFCVPFLLVYKSLKRVDFKSIICLAILLHYSETVITFKIHIFGVITVSSLCLGLIISVSATMYSMEKVGVLNEIV